MIPSTGIIKETFQRKTPRRFSGRFDVLSLSDENKGVSGPRKARKGLAIFSVLRKDDDLGIQLPGLNNGDCLNLSLCLECGGRCCQGSPGIWIDPERFFDLFFPGQRLTVAQLREQLPELGLVLWEKSNVPIPAPRSLITGCAFLGPGGCRLSIAERPCQCLALIPNKETLLRQQGCFCQMPEEYNFEVGRQRWQNYWQTV